MITSKLCEILQNFPTDLNITHPQFETNCGSLMEIMRKDPAIEAGLK